MSRKDKAVFVFAVFSALALLFIDYRPASAVRVKSVDPGIETPEGQPKRPYEVITTGVRPDLDSLKGHSYLKVKVIAAFDEKPVPGVMAYVVRLPDEDETVMFTTDGNGETIVWGSLGAKRRLVVWDGDVSIKKDLNIACSKPTDAVMIMPYDAAISARLRTPSNDFSFWVKRRNDKTGRFERAEYSATTSGTSDYSAIKLRVPAGTYRAYGRDMSKGLKSKDIGPILVTVSKGKTAKVTF